MGPGFAAETASTDRCRRTARAAVGATALVVLSAQRAFADVAPLPPRFPEKQLSLPESEGTLVMALYATVIAATLRLAYLGAKKLMGMLFRAR